MNNLSDCVKNYLLIVDSHDYKQQLYKLCLEKVKDGCLIVLITCEIYDFSIIVTELCLSKDQLKNFIIMHFNTIDDISRKLLLLHSWSLMPYMITVDLPQLLNTETLTSSSASATFVQKVALCSAALLVYLESVATAIAKVSNSNNTIIGLLLLRKTGEHFDEKQIQTIRDLYFYKTEMLHNFKGLRDLMFKT